jgi:hypothetical protein
MESRGKEIYTHSPRVAFRKIGGSFVLVNIKDNRILRLNETGTEIWGLLDGRDVDGIAESLSNAFDVPRESALEDVIEFLKLLSSRGLVIRDDGI